MPEKKNKWVKMGEEPDFQPLLNLRISKKVLYVVVYVEEKSGVP
tara:strand:+ start:9022 stop:9153 length:132 start_codon:yes stop_codon:yes gene_type:complete